MISIHDNRVMKYEVDLQGKLITILTKNAIDINIIFTDVFAHYFENELIGSIILDIEQYDLQTFLEDNYALIESRKNSCWPIYYDTIPDLMKYIADKQYEYYYITSSYGLRGWVLAKHIDIVEV